MNIVIAIAIALVILFSIVILMKVGNKEYEESEEQIGYVNRIEGNKAKEKAILYLQDRAFFSCLPASESSFVGEEFLPEMVLSILSKYEAIETECGPRVVISRRNITESASHPGYIVIGHGMAGSDVEFSIGLIKNEERIFELYPGESPDPKFGTYTSIYHWIIAAAKGIH